MITPVNILALFAVLLAFVGLLALVDLRRRLERTATILEQQTHTMLAMQGAIKILSGEAVTHREDLAVVLRAIERIGEVNQETRLEMRLRDADSSPYTQAIQLIRHGQTRAEVRKLCSLTESEVDLLFNLHGLGVGPGLDAGSDERN